MSICDDAQDHLPELRRDAQENPRIHQGMMVSCYDDVNRDPHNHMGYGRVLKLVWDKFCETYFCHVLMFETGETLCFPSLYLERQTTCKSVTFAVMKQKSEMI